MILQQKPFLKQQYAQVLKPQIIAILSRWLAVNDQDRLTERIFNTTREMFTVIKNQLFDVPTSQGIHAKHDELNCTLPRFDKMIKTIENDRVNKKHFIGKRSNSTTRAMQDVGGRRCKSYFETMDLKVGSRHEHHNATNDSLDPNRTVLGGRFVDTMRSKQLFLSGDKEAVMYQDKNRPNHSSYQVSIKGIQVSNDRQATILDNQWTSFVGQIIPDPTLMGKSHFQLLLIYDFFLTDTTNNRFNSIEKDRKAMAERMGETGFTSPFRSGMTYDEKRMSKHVKTSANWSRAGPQMFQ